MIFFLNLFFDEGISTVRFPDILKSAKVEAVFKEKSRIDKKILDSTAFGLYSLKCSPVMMEK